jgi:hypothetical protein
LLGQAHARLTIPDASKSAAPSSSTSTNEIDGSRREGVRVGSSAEEVVIGWPADELPLSGCVERCNVIARNGAVPPPRCSPGCGQAKQEYPGQSIREN